MNYIKMTWEDLQNFDLLSPPILIWGEVRLCFFIEISRKIYRNISDTQGTGRKLDLNRMLNLCLLPRGEQLLPTLKKLEHQRPFHSVHWGITLPPPPTKTPSPSFLPSPAPLNRQTIQAPFFR